MAFSSLLVHMTTNVLHNKIYERPVCIDNDLAFQSHSNLNDLQESQIDKFLSECNTAVENVLSVDHGVQESDDVQLYSERYTLWQIHSWRHFISSRHHTCKIPMTTSPPTLRSILSVKASASTMILNRRLNLGLVKASRTDLQMTQNEIKSWQNIESTWAILLVSFHGDPGNHSQQINNFHSHFVRTVNESQSDLIDCFERDDHAVETKLQPNEISAKRNEIDFCTRKSRPDCSWTPSSISWHQYEVPMLARCTSQSFQQIECESKEHFF